MRKLIVSISATLILAATAGHASADYCSKYKFGSVEWWECRISDKSNPR